jgi:hypothetical protein
VSQLGGGVLGTSVVAAGPQILWQPQPGPQTHLIACPVFEVFFGGARGGGKTESSLGDWLEHSAMYGEDAVGIFVRRKFKQLVEVIARAKQLFIPLGAKYNEQKAEFKMPGGGRLKFVYLERDSDAEEYQGHNYTRVYVEEATNFPSPAPINKLKATLRSAKGVPCGMRLTGNPGGPGHNWVKARYIDPCPAGYKIITEEEEVELPDGKKIIASIDRVFIPSKLGDNALLLQNDPTYVLRLRQSGSEALVKAWLTGNWDIVDGAFFNEFDESLHVLAMDWLDVIPKTALRFRAFDWGSAKPFSVGWYALSNGEWGLPFGALVKYREWYGSCGPNKGLKMTADKVADGILIREKGERIHYGAADPSIFIRNGGPSIGETMIVQGCSWKRGDNRRQPGWEQLRQRLVGDGQKPMLYFLECCDDTIRTLPSLQHDEKDPEDLDTEAEDHAADETRYAVMSRPWQPRQGVPAGSNLPKLPQQKTISELIAARTRKRKLAEGNSKW